MTDINEFLKPRLVGDRFQGKTLPLELFRDLAVLEDMVIEIAKWCYLCEHPGRQRVPQGFTEGVSLRMTDLSDGSAVPHLSLYAESHDLMPPANLEYYTKARVQLIGAINAANDGGASITEYLPKNILSYFDRMGRSLEEGETIEFDPSNTESPAALTRETRRRLLASSQIQEVTDDVTLRGLIYEADQRDMSFKVQLVSGRIVSANMPAQHLETVLEAFNGYQNNTLVMIKGVGRYNRNQKLTSIEEVEHITLLDPNDIGVRAEVLKTLKDGWLDGYNGIAPKNAFLDWLVDRFYHHYPDDRALPFIYPTVEGGVQVEWSGEDEEVTLEIDPETYEGEWHRLTLTSGAEEVQDLNLEKLEVWDWVAAEIKKIQGGR